MTLRDFNLHQTGRVVAAAATVCLAMALVIDPVHHAVIESPGMTMDLKDLLPWQYLSTFILMATVVFMAYSSNLSGSSLGIALFLPLFGASFSAQLEAVVFINIPIQQSIGRLISFLIQAILITSIVVVLTEKKKEEVISSRRFSLLSWIGRFGLGALAYLILYLIAGILILPYVEHAYTDQPVMTDPNLPLILIPLELLRGILLIAMVLPLIRSIPGSPWRIGFLVAILYIVVNGLAPLIPPNPYMSSDIRMYHIIEISWSNFVFGLIVGRLFYK